MCAAPLSASTSIGAPALRKERAYRSLTACKGFVSPCAPAAALLRVPCSPRRVRDTILFGRGSSPEIGARGRAARLPFGPRRRRPLVLARVSPEEAAQARRVRHGAEEESRCYKSRCRMRGDRQEGSNHRAADRSGIACPHDARKEQSVTRCVADFVWAVLRRSSCLLSHHVPQLRQRALFPTFRILQCAFLQPFHSWDSSSPAHKAVTSLDPLPSRGTGNQRRHDQQRRGGGGRGRCGVFVACRQATEDR